MRFLSFGEGPLIHLVLGLLLHGDLDRNIAADRVEIGAGMVSLNHKGFGLRLVGAGEIDFQLDLNFTFAHYVVSKMVSTMTGVPFGRLITPETIRA